MTEKEIFEFLDQKADEFNVPKYIESDPIQIPHRFSIKQDVEIMGFLASTIAWGNRKSIIKSAEKMVDFMGNSPFDFVMSAEEKHFEKLSGAVHRTFSAEDFKVFVFNLKRVYSENESLENLFLLKENETNFYHALERFRQGFLTQEPHRSHKHIGSSYKNSACKRLMMFLRWMVRKDNKGVDFGLWENISQEFLSCPLDVHSGNISRKLGVLTRKQNDWKAVEELDQKLRKYKPEDPALYDYALFGLGVFEGF